MLYPIFLCACFHKSPLHYLSCYLPTVTLMTVTKSEYQRPFCPVLPAAEFNGFTIFAVFSRYAELLLMDNNSSSCIVGHDHENTVLHLVSYIYTPSKINALKVVLDIAGLACMDSRLIVYHQKYVIKHDVIPYRQCVLTATNARPDTRRCEFICYVNVCSRATVIAVHIEVQKIPWVTKYEVKICDTSII